MGQSIIKNIDAAFKEREVEINLSNKGFTDPEFP